MLREVGSDDFIFNRWSLIDSVKSPGVEILGSLEGL